MPTRLLDGAAVDTLLPMDRCIDLMEQTLTSLSRGEAVQPLRTILRVPGKGAFGVMPAIVGTTATAIGVKVLTVFPGNHGTGLDSHQGVILVFEPERGSLAGIIDASRVTAIRTAAVSGLATRFLAREHAGDLCILGSGVQARSHLEAVLAVRPVRRVRLWSPTPAHALAFAAWAESRCPCPVEVCAEPEMSVRGAEIICAVTAARDPVVVDGWVEPGTHINAVGASLPESRELSSALVARARLFVDRVESARKEAGDFLVPLAEGVVRENHIVGEIGAVALGQVPGRRSAEEITIFKSLGLAVEDVAVGEYLVREAERRGIGTLVDLGGRRDGTA